jgi:hypothetical protein
MKEVKQKDDVLEVIDSKTSDPQLVEKEIELGYFENYLFEGTGPSKHFQGSCTRIHYCSCNCHDCSFISSDSRLKKDISENVPGLTFINKLRPVTYHLDAEQVENNRLQTGFIAQEVAEVAKENGFDFHGISYPTNENEYYALQYSSFVVPLVKAVQELTIKNDMLSKKIENQHQEIISMQKLLKELVTENVSI